MRCQNQIPLSVKNWLYIGNKIYLAIFPVISINYQPLAIRNSAIFKKTRYFRTNDTFPDQWVFGPMTHFFGPLVCGPMTLFRTNGSSDQWVVGPMGCRTIKTSPKIYSIIVQGTMHMIHYQQVIVIGSGQDEGTISLHIMQLLLLYVT